MNRQSPSTFVVQEKSATHRWGSTQRITTVSVRRAWQTISGQGHKVYLILIIILMIDADHVTVRCAVVPSCGGQLKNYLSKRQNWGGGRPILRRFGLTYLSIIIQQENPSHRINLPRYPPKHNNQCAHAHRIPGSSSFSLVISMRCVFLDQPNQFAISSEFTGFDCFWILPRSFVYVFVLP